MATKRILPFLLMMIIFLAPWQFYIALPGVVTISIVQILMFIAISLWLINEWAQGVRRLEPFEFWPFLFIFSMLIAALVAADRVSGFKFFFKWSLAVCLFFVTERSVKDIKTARRCIAAALFGAAIVMVIGFIEFLAGADKIFRFVHEYKNIVGIFVGPGTLHAFLSENIFLNQMNWFYWIPETWTYWVRPFGTFMAVSAFTLFLGMTVGYVPYFYERNKHSAKRFFFSTSTALFVLIIILTFARSAWLGLIAIVCTALWLIGKRKHIIMVIIILGCIVGVGTATNDNFNKILHDRIFSFSRESSTQIRVELWRQALDVIVARPVTGIGLGQYEEGLKLVSSGPYRSAPAHNDYLQVWAEMGIGGVVAFIMVILQGLIVSYRLLKNTKNADFYLSLGFLLTWLWFLIQAFFDTNIFDDKISVLFWIMSGLNIVVYKNWKQRSKTFEDSHSA